MDTSAFHHAFALKYYVWQGGVGAAAPAASFVGKDQTCAGIPGPESTPEGIYGYFNAKRL